jgi:hypothetical protein
LDVFCLLDDGRAKVLVAGNNEEVIRVLEEGQGTALMRGQVWVSSTFPEGSLDVLVKADGASD